MKGVSPANYETTVPPEEQRVQLGIQQSTHISMGPHQRPKIIFKVKRFILDIGGTLTVAPNPKTNNTAKEFSIYSIFFKGKKKYFSLKLMRKSPFIQENVNFMAYPME